MTISRSLVFVNASTNHPDVVQYEAPIAAAIDRQLAQLAHDWGEYVWALHANLNAQGFKVVMADDDAQVQGALAYHDVRADGSPYAMVLMDEIFKYGGTWLTGDLSVSGAVSHEICELIGDPGANRWATDAQGQTWALELCDPVQSSSYVLGGVSVSNFVFPSYFNPFGQHPYDLLGVLTAPFQIASGGYAINQQSGAMYGESFPEWRKDYAARTGARTAARLAQVHA